MANAREALWSHQTALARTLDEATVRRVLVLDNRVQISQGRPHTKAEWADWRLWNALPP